MRFIRNMAFGLTMVVLLPGLFFPAQAAKYTFTYATHAVENSFRGRAELAFLNEVKRATDNQVDFKIFWGASLMQGNEVLRGVSSGIVDLGLVNINYYAKQLLASNALNTIQESSGTYEGLVSFLAAAYREIPELAAELRKNRNEPLYVYGCMAMTFVSTKPMVSLENLKGQKARAASRWLLPLMKELGAQPVSVPWGDCNMALQTNVIDTVFSNLDAINMVKMDEAAPNILIYEGFYPTSSYLITMNSKKFASLPENIRLKFQEAARNATKRLPGLYESDYAAIREAQKKAGYAVATVSKEDAARWESLPGIAENKRQWIEEARAAGMQNAESVLEKVYSLFYAARDKNQK